MSLFNQEKLAQQKLLEILKKFQLVVEIQDKQINELQDRVRRLEDFIYLDKKENASDYN